MRPFETGRGVGGAFRRAVSERQLVQNRGCCTTSPDNDLKVLGRLAESTMDALRHKRRMRTVPRQVVPGAHPVGSCAIERQYRADVAHRADQQTLQEVSK